MGLIQLIIRILIHSLISTSYRKLVFLYMIQYVSLVKKFTEKNRIKILLKYLLRKEKIYLDPIYNSTVASSKKIITFYEDLSSTIEELSYLNQVIVKDIQLLLRELLNICIKKIIENTTWLCNKSRDYITGVLYPRNHIKKRINCLSIYYMNSMSRYNFSLNHYIY